MGFTQERETFEQASTREGCIRGDVVGSFLFRSLSPSLTTVTCQFKLDLKTPLIDPKLNDMVLKHFAPLLLPMLAKQAKKFEPGGDLESVKTSHADTYGELFRRLSALHAGTTPTAGPP